MKCLDHRIHEHVFNLAAGGGLVDVYAVVHHFLAEDATSSSGYLLDAVNRAVVALNANAVWWQEEACPPSTFTAGDICSARCLDAWGGETSAPGRADRISQGGPWPPTKPSEDSAGGYVPDSARS